MYLSYLLAVVAATVNATSNVLQRKADREEPPHLAMSFRLVLDLVHRPVWLAGFGAVILSFVITAAALDHGALAVVQPILVLELPLTLLLATRTLGARLGRREWGASLAMVAGLGGMLAVLAPGSGHTNRVDGLEWGLAAGATAAAAVAAVAFSRTGSRTRRAALLGVGSGILFGLTAAFMKGMTGALVHGFGHIFVVWQTYAMAACGAAALFLAQNALQAGRLLVAQPGITLCDPAVGMLWGIIVFDEAPRGGLAVVAAVACGLVLVGGVFVLMHSPQLADALTSGEHPAQPGAHRPDAAGAAATLRP